MKSAVNPHRSIEAEILAETRDVLDFPTPGVVFKDLAPVWADVQLRKQCIASIVDWVRKQETWPTAIAGIESRGFLFGMALAHELELPFVALRKEGKLPGETYREEYALEYGTSALECQQTAFNPLDQVLIHDDVLATGGTAVAAGSLVGRSGAGVWGFSFVLELTFLNGARQVQSNFRPAPCHSLASIEK